MSVKKTWDVETTKNSVLITKAKADSVKMIVEERDISLELLFNSNHKLVGYKLVSNTLKLNELNNAFMFVFDAPTVAPFLNVLYEDKNVRMIEYKGDAHNEYLLVTAARLKM